MHQLRLAVVAVATLLAAAGVVGYAPKQSHNKIVSCYYSSWAVYRPGLGQFEVEDIDPFLCTHGFYAFADMSNSTWEIFSVDPWFDLGPSDCAPGACFHDGFRRFVALQDSNPAFVPMLSVGGWNAGSGKYSVMAEDPVKRRTFIDSTVVFLKKYGFAGVDFDWEYPGFREGSHPDIDKNDFDLVAQEFSEALRAENLLFTAALGCGYDKIMIGYDMPVLTQYFDFFNLMGYDFHGAWDNFTGQNAPLYHREEENVVGHPGYRYNTYDSIELFLELGTPPSQMVLGMPTYGRGQHLTTDSSGHYCPTDIGFPMGPYTRQRGILGYLEILQLFANDTYTNLPGATPHEWEVVVDTCYMAPYMTNGPYWMSYDDEESLAHKVRYANWRGLAGAMIWTVETDDFGGFYSERPYPLLTRINEELANQDIYDPAKPGCGTSVLCDVPLIPPPRK